MAAKEGRSSNSRNRDSTQKWKKNRRPKSKLGSRRTSSFKNPNKIPLRGNKKVAKKIDSEAKKPEEQQPQNNKAPPFPPPSTTLSASEQLSFFLTRFQSSCNLKLSSLELEPIKDTSIVKLSEDLDQDTGSLSEHVKAAFGASWKEVLCEGRLIEGKVDPGSPAVLVISTSAIRSLELLRGLRLFTGECRAAKLFSKHMKVEEQVAVLKGRVNIASGTPSRIKKLIDMDAMGLSRLAVILLDMHMDAKGYSLFSLPQVSDEFWDLYKSHFHDRVVQGDLRICLYGPVAFGKFNKKARISKE